ncbi:MAG TPA: hypothetical protein PK171_05875 [Atribacter sp.]|jgi:hypothetical protein|uniref:DUF6544 family protein n=1 Tax=Atribacter sp. TaxID=2847780 RepID=UPI0017561289|nr:hypothetical protein [Candidatus Atribacteria bacterium]HOT05750.1 hypothetical protein [Atribacter sp.]
MKALCIVILILVIVVALFLVGIHIKPRPFPPFPRSAKSILKTIPLPDGLPKPVERFYQLIYGENIPVIDSAIVSGRLRLRIMGITFPGRFRFVHETGKGYRHYIETTLLGFPIMKVNEFYLNGKGRLELPFGISESPEIDQGGNLGMWAESTFFPAIWLTDPKVRWEPLDQDSSILVVPFGEQEERFIVRFDSQTGYLKLMEAMRYKSAGDKHKVLWLAETLKWGSIDKHNLMIEGSATWLDEGKPWAVFTVDDVVYQVDVSEYLQAHGL